MKACFLSNDFVCMAQAIFFGGRLFLLSAVVCSPKALVCLRSGVPQLYFGPPRSMHTMALAAHSYSPLSGALNAHPIKFLPPYFRCFA